MTPRIGDGVDAIDTPALVVDLDAMERNLARMAGFAAEHRMRLRPHAKMHKSAAIAKLPIEQVVRALYPFFGALLVVLADLAARMIPTEQELKLGVVTALFGAPAFALLAWRAARSWRS